MSAKRRMNAIQLKWNDKRQVDFLFIIIIIIRFSLFLFCINNNK